MLTDNNGTNMYMPVAPAYGYGNGNNSGFGGDNAWWIIILLLFGWGGGRFGNFGGFGGGFGSNGGGDITIGSVNDGYNGALQRGFDQQAIMTSLTGIGSSVNQGFANTATSLCNGFSGVNATVNQGFATAEVANNARQMANMQQQFNTQTAITGSLNGLQSQLAQCCCDNRLATANLQSVILSENCADRAEVSNGVRDILANQTANTNALINATNQAVQGVYDKICALELDAKNDKIADLQNQLQQARFNASQVAQTQRLLLDNQAQTQALEQYLNPTPIPAYPVQNPNCCNGNWGFNNGCGCGN